MMLDLVILKLDIYSYDLSALSKTLGATWIERHFTILKKMRLKTALSLLIHLNLKLRQALDSPNSEILNYIRKI